ncbi:MAG: putative Co/Zn/Cd efflux system rane fusion protein, partial [Planctomycetaceae bacterium]|nr:putative Co/Zn/Cd efflux system rane fusion protein [Planctomycetaceae bacterium]
WWWFDFLILVKLARLRFVAVLVVIGAVITQWDTLVSYYEKYTRPTGDAVAVAGDTEFFCPMHPSVVRDNGKDKCPICFMPLSKRKKGETSDAALPAGVVSRVQLTPYRVVLAGVRTWQVDYVPLSKQIAAVGYVDFNERGFKSVSARVKGRIDTLVSNETGKNVNAGEELASIYSPDLNVTVQTLVDAQKRNNPEQLKSSRQRLSLLGIGDDQIDEILKSGKSNTHLRIRSPITGHIIKKYVREGQYVDEGMPLYDIADLSSVWIQAQVHEDDFRFLPMAEDHSKVAFEQLPVKAIVRAYPEQEFPGVISFIYPHVDQETRTVTVRVEIKNPGHVLRPGMTATVFVNVPPQHVSVLQNAAKNSPERQQKLNAGQALVVPESAVIDTGRQKVVYRQSIPGEFEGVLVTLGPRMMGPENVQFYPLLSGLEPGDQIVTSGSFLVDAETRLNPAAGSIYIGGSGGSSSSQPSKTVRPSTPEDQDLKIELTLAKLTVGDRELVRSQQFCPILTETRLGSMGVPVKLMVEGESVFICCPSCQKNALKDPAETLKKVQELKANHQKNRAPGKPKPASDKGARIQAALSKLGPEDRKLAQGQKFCVIRKTTELGSMGKPVKLLRDGKPVFLCCEGCTAQAQEEWPELKRAIPD